MVRSTSRRSLHPWMLLALLAAVACTAVTTRVVGWYVTRQIDGYLDLTSEQRGRVRASVDETLDRARREDLPRWLYLFRRLRDTVGEGATDARLRELQQRYDWLTDDALKTLAPKLAAVFARLSDAQISHFEREMRETLDETYEEQQLDPSRRREKLDERLIESIEELTGELRDSQVRVILRAAHAMPEEREAQYRVGKQRIAAGADFLRGHPGEEAIEAEIRRLWRTRYEVLGPGRGKEARRAEQRTFLLAVDATLSRAQREHAVEEINDRIRKARRFVLPSP